MGSSQHAIKKAYDATFRFQKTTGESCNAVEWLTEWENKYPSKDYNEDLYNELIQKAGALVPQDFILIGRWKDAAWTKNKWRPNVASVAYAGWIEASIELPGLSVVPEAFLNEWCQRLYPDTSSRSVNGQKRFGLSRATTLLHLMSAAKFPIYDSRVRRAIRRVCKKHAPNQVEWYIKSYIPIFEALVELCSAIPRSVDKALFAYGGNKKIDVFRTRLGYPAGRNARSSSVCR